MLPPKEITGTNNFLDSLVNAMTPGLNATADVDTHVLSLIRWLKLLVMG